MTSYSGMILLVDIRSKLIHRLLEMTHPVQSDIYNTQLSRMKTAIYMSSWILKSEVMQCLPNNTGFPLVAYANFQEFPGSPKRFLQDSATVFNSMAANAVEIDRNV